MTALFADVVRSMDIAAAVDIERLRDIMTELAQRLAAVVQRFGGGTIEYTGDGLMALFGAPIALEDHAFRACLAALAIQDEASRLAADVLRRDGVQLRVRVGLNSGRIIAGETGSGAMGYTATGQPIGFAQRMESAAPPGEVMLSDSTAQLVEHAVMLGDVEWVYVKGTDQPVPARRLVGVAPRDGPVARPETSLVGRRWEMSALEAMVDCAIDGRGAVVNVVGPPGIGKSRAAREAAALAERRGVAAFWAFCESHARDVPFHSVTRLLRARLGVAEVGGSPARDRVREQLPEVGEQDLLLLNDLLGIADPEIGLPQIDPEARRRRLTALINSATLARADPVLYLIEDAHWIDAVSESMLADFLAVISRTPTMVLITSRPEYEGALTRVHGTQTIALAPLADSDTAALLVELLGSDHSVGQLATIIAERAAGNPFFTEEMVRELVQRGVLVGDRGNYVCGNDVAEVTVPATVQAAIEARIDRLTTAAKRTLNAASVIGARFDAKLLAVLGAGAAIDELLGAELIDQVRSSPQPEYAFCHPLIRAVAYESQLKSDRAQWHQRVAAAIEASDEAAADENAALIAEHLEAAGELHAAYTWRMRAATWATYRDIAAAQQSWERARAIADLIPDDDAERTSMRIAPRTMLCGMAYRIHTNVASDSFDELRTLCTAAEDRASLAIAMAGLALDHAFGGRLREGSRLASEAWTLSESIGDPALTVGVSFPVTYAKAHHGEFRDVLLWSQRTIELTGGDPARGNLLFGSPLAIAFASRGISRYCLGVPGWHDDLSRGMAIARSADPLSYAAVVAYVYFPGIPFGALAADDRAVCEIEQALRIAEQSGDDLAVVFARATLGIALVNRHSDKERDRGQQLLAEASDVFQSEGHNLSNLAFVKVCSARERARRGDRYDAVPLVRTAVEYPASQGGTLAWGFAVPATALMVETLLEGAAEADLLEAEATIERFATAPSRDVLVIRDVWLLRLRAQLARARGDDVGYRDLLNRHRALAESLGFEGHIAWAASMTASAERGG